jgi:hypothetical protein
MKSKTSAMTREADDGKNDGWDINPSILSD